eukprot:TRINITY_DN66094_c0_g1_i1.p1 TRINITY_DN66094_c0_g1~~TRINITY_DN66094_c0_g1_i1.p1  ORF type:complete len:231 (+),score=61.70 TRINITY_DN66094_c0_g1_i1:88-780(+)
MPPRNHALRAPGMAPPGAVPVPRLAPQRGWVRSAARTIAELADALAAQITELERPTHGGGSIAVTARSASELGIFLRIQSVLCKRGGPVSVTVRIPEGEVIAENVPPDPDTAVLELCYTRAISLPVVGGDPQLDIDWTFSVYLNTLKMCQQLGKSEREGRWQTTVTTGKQLVLLLAVIAVVSQRIICDTCAQPAALELFCTERSHCELLITLVYSPAVRSTADGDMQDVV